MSLSSDELAMLERGMRDGRANNAERTTLLNLAYRQLNELMGQHRKALRVAEQLLYQRNRSLCFRAAQRWLQVKRYFGRG